MVSNSDVLGCSAFAVFSSLFMKMVSDHERYVIASQKSELLPSTLKGCHKNIKKNHKKQASVWFKRYF